MSSATLAPQTGSLFNLSGQLFELMEARDEAAELVSTTIHWCSKESIDIEADAGVIEHRAELAAIDAGIRSFVVAKLQEVDELRSPVKALEAAIALNQADAAAATNRAVALQNRLDKLKDLVKLCMEELAAGGYWKPKQSRKFESARGSILLRGNGGAQPVVITDESLIPDEYWISTCVFPLNELTAFADVANSNPTTRLAWSRLLFSQKSGKREVSKSAIAAALDKACPKCNGLLPRSEGFGLPMWCDQCGGSGKAGVPGAHLADRGCSVQIK